MIRSLSAQAALLFFSATLVAGLWVGNSPSTILLRAMIALVAAFVLTQFVAWAARAALRDHLVRRKLAIDRGHLDRLNERRDEQGTDVSVGPEAG